MSRAGVHSVPPAPPVPRVVRNDWSTVAVPELAGWRPTRSVSVVVPAFQCQATLDLTLASLRGQTYPDELFEVVVVDDGSDPPLVLPPIRPRRTVLVRVERSGESGWGRANALVQGVAHSSGEILHWLDADMVAYPDHVAAQARWQHVLPYAVTLGYKRFVDPAEDGSWPAPEAVADAARHGAMAGLFGGEPGEPHVYVERQIAQTDQLRAANHLAFRIHVGATAALTRKLYDAAGGLDAHLRLGEDTEFGYRLAQAGAVFVPEPAARSWHLGRTHVMRHREQVSRYNRPFLADRVPHPRHWRKVGGPAFTVPLAEVVLTVGDHPLERVRAAVDSVLHGTEYDIRVSLVGPWDTLDDGRLRVLHDPRLDLRLIAESYRGEPRVRLVTAPPESAFPAPYLVELPAAYGLAPDALRRLIDLADRHQVGAVRVASPRPVAPPPPTGHGSSPEVAHPRPREAAPETATGSSVPLAAGSPILPATGSPVLLWRTAALHRARWVRAADESLRDAVTSVYGHREATADEIGVVDLTPYAPTELAAGAAALLRPGRRRGGLTPSAVEVEGVRSLARATVVVAWLGGRRLTSFLRSPGRRVRHRADGPEGGAG